MLSVRKPLINPLNNFTKKRQASTYTQLITCRVTVHFA